MDTDRTIELMWIHFVKDSRPCYVAGLYHPPDHPYHEARLLEALEQSLDEIAQIHSDALICIAGDFNQLKDSNMQLLGLVREMTPPTRGDNCLDRIDTNFPVYASVDVFQSTV